MMMKKIIKNAGNGAFIRVFGYFSLFLSVCVFLQLVIGVEGAAFSRQDIAGGEWWRLLTSHLVHANLQHMLWNMGGALLCMLVFRHDVPVRHWLYSAVFISLFSSLCMYFVYLSGVGYVGFSDTLYGWILMGLLALLPKEKLLAIVLLTLLVGRLLYEYFVPGSPFDDVLSAGRVAKESHLYGLLGGFLYALFFFRSFRKHLFRSL